MRRSNQIRLLKAAKTLRLKMAAKTTTQKSKTGKNPQPSEHFKFTKGEFCMSAFDFYRVCMLQDRKAC